jgi:hypothetical protein
MKNYSIHIAYQTRNSEAFSYEYSPQAPHEPPWNPYAQRISAFQPGFAAFEYPAPLGNGDFLESQDENTPGPSSPCKLERSHNNSSQVLPNEKQSREDQVPLDTRGWEIAVVKDGGMLVYGNSVEGRSKFGRTKGKHLDKPVAEKAARVRKVGACWNCWVQKASVS